jgi:NitT/TauT family transport system substrate-binding protein
MSMLKSRFVAFSMAMAAAIAIVLQPVSARALDQVTLRLAWIAGFGGDQVPFFLGKSKGFYKEQGIELTIVDGRGAASNATLLAQKSEQFAVIDANVLALSVGSGLPIRSIGSFVQQAPFNLIYGAKSGIKSFADLKGKTVGLQPGEAMTALFSALLTAHKVDPSSVRIVSVTGANKPQILYQGQADVVGGYVTGEFFRIKLGAPAGFDVEQLLYKDGGITTLNASVATHTDLIKENPDLVKRFMAATVKSWEYAKQHPEEAADETLKAAPKSNREFLNETFGWVVKLSQTESSTGKPMGWTSEQDWTSTLNLLEKHVDLKNRQPASVYFTNEFIPSR